MKTIEKNQISGFVRKNEKGEVMNTQQYLKMYDVPQVEVDTKLGKKVVWSIDYPDGLAEGVKNLIFDDFYPIALTAFNQNRSEAFQKDVWKHLFKVDKLYLTFNDGVEYAMGENSLPCFPRGIAFRTITEHDIDGKQVAYIEGTAVDPNYQGYGFYQAFTNLLGDDYKFVVSRTQNPVVVTALSRVFKHVNPFVQNWNSSLVSIGAGMAKKLEMKGYNEGTMICRGFYGKALSGLPPKINNEIAKTMRCAIDRENGDCILVVCSN